MGEGISGGVGAWTSSKVGQRGSGDWWQWAASGGNEQHLVTGGVAAALAGREREEILKIRSNLGIETHNFLLYYDAPLLLDFMSAVSVLHYATISFLVPSRAFSWSSLAIITSLFLPRRQSSSSPASVCQRCIVSRSHGSPLLVSLLSSLQSMIFKHMSKECIDSIVTAQSESAQLFQPVVGCKVMTLSIINHPERGLSNLKLYSISLHKAKLMMEHMFRDKLKGGGNRGGHEENSDKKGRNNIRGGYSPCCYSFST
jgi:hypothetical protein